jgi:hypothetical protein
VGVAGFYAAQVEGDELFGVAIPPDGLRAEVLELGGVINFDMPEYNSSVKVKALDTRTSGVDKRQMAIDCRSTPAAMASTLTAHGGLHFELQVRPLSRRRDKARCFAWRGTWSR